MDRPDQVICCSGDDRAGIDLLAFGGFPGFPQPGKPKRFTALEDDVDRLRISAKVTTRFGFMLPVIGA